MKRRLPHCDVKILAGQERQRYEAEGEPLESSLTLEDQIGGQLEAGFVVTGVLEDTYGERKEDPLSKYVLHLIATRATKLIMEDL